MIIITMVLVADSKEQNRHKTKANEQETATLKNCSFFMIKK